MMPRLLLVVLSALLVVWGAAVRVHSAEAERPNVLIVLIDDAGYGDFGCHGHPFLKTPHIDRLHGESVRFTDFHVAPMCSPTRGQLLTGCHGLRTGVTSVTAGRTFLRPEFATAPQLFSKAGWRTGLFGKWHLGDSYPHRPMDKGFQEAVWTRGWGFTSAPEFANTLMDGKVLRGTKEERFPGYITDFCFDEAMKWMAAQQKADEPFFCFLPLHAAHSPHTVAEKYSAPFAPRPMKGFFGMLANIDENMGRMEAFLTESGLKENTIVLFLTDNGGTAGVKAYNAGLRGRKTEYYEGGHRVPCFVRWPAGVLKTSRDVTELTQVQDLLPTLLDLCGVKNQNSAGPGFDGVSLAGLLKGTESTLPDRAVFIQYGPGAGEVDTSGPRKDRCAVLWKQWRLVHGTELYDVEKDRAQERDIAAEHPEIVAEMKKRYDAWWATVEPGLRDFVPVALGAEQENPVELTSSDWQDAYADNSRHIREAAGGPRGGPWNVDVLQAGEYEVTLSRWPFDQGGAISGNITPPGKALPILEARMKIAGHELAEPVAVGAKTVTFKLTLPKGRTQLHAWFTDAKGGDVCGAYFARVQRM